jgi:hypothetical protein
VIVLKGCSEFAVESFVPPQISAPPLTDGNGRSGQEKQKEKSLHVY